MNNFLLPLTTIVYVKGLESTSEPGMLMFWLFRLSVIQFSASYRLGLELELESVLLLIVHKRAMWLFKEMQFSFTAPCLFFFFFCV